MNQDAATQLPPSAGRRLPAEWEPAGAVLLAWPRADGDWAPYLQEVRSCYRRLLTALTQIVPVLLLVDEPERVRQELGPELAALTQESAAAQDSAATPEALASPAPPRLRLLASPARDTWTRDYGPITVLLEPEPPGDPRAAAAQVPLAAAAAAQPGAAAAAGPGAEPQEQPLLLNFAFNGWGGKYASGGDDAATRALHASGALGTVPLERHELVLEGGSIESDGRGTLLATSTCLLAPSRNPQLERPSLEAELKRRLGVKRVLWLQQQALAGDDTDAHIDTLVRFCPHDTLVYVRRDPAPLASATATGNGAGQPSTEGDPATETGGKARPDSVERSETGASPEGQPGGAFSSADPLERQLRALRTPEGHPYRLVPLPPGPARQAPDDGRPLPATYANALLLNGTVLLPVYGDPERDAAAVAAWQQACPGWSIAAIDCSALLLQHGSLHCATMQIPAAVFR